MHIYKMSRSTPRRFETALALAPCISASTHGLPHHVMDQGFVVFQKVSMMAKLGHESIPSNPIDFCKLPADLQILIRFLHVAPVLSALTAIDAVRLDMWNSLRLTHVPQLGPTWRNTAVNNPQLVNYSILMTWTV